MRLPSFVLMVALAACRFQANGDRDGGGSSIDAAVHADANADAGSGSGLADTDGDGVADGLDNCPQIANPGQYDFDHDGLGDVCDPCPQIAGSAANADPDGDHIGSACDPHPDGSDKRVAFYNFRDDPTSLASWTSDGGTWALGSGGLVGSASGNGANLTATDALVNPVLEAQFVPKSAKDEDDETDVAVCDGANSCCGVYDTVSDGDPGTPYAFVHSQDDQTAAWSAVFLGNPVTVRLSFTDSSTLQCELASSPAHVTLQNGGVKSTASNPQFFVSDGTAVFDYLFVIDSE
jgi:hypothetical protein